MQQGQIWESLLALMIGDFTLLATSAKEADAYFSLVHADHKVVVEQIKANIYWGLNWKCYSFVPFYSFPLS